MTSPPGARLRKREEEERIRRDQLARDAEQATLGLYPIVTLQYSSTALHVYQVSDHIQ